MDNEEYDISLTGIGGNGSPSADFTGPASVPEGSPAAVAFDCLVNPNGAPAEPLTFDYDVDAAWVFGYSVDWEGDGWSSPSPPCLRIRH